MVSAAEGMAAQIGQPKPLAGIIPYKKLHDAAKHRPVAMGRIPPCAQMAVEQPVAYFKAEGLCLQAAIVLGHVLGFVVGFRLRLCGSTARTVSITGA